MPPFGSPFSEIQLKSLMKDDLYWNGAHPDSNPYHDMVGRAFANAYPGPQRHDDTGRAIAAKPVTADPSGFHTGRVSLTAPVGEGGANRGRDMGHARRIFETLGLLDGGFSDRKKAEPEPQVLPRLSSAIRGFQNMFGLKTDGLMNPGGPTARMLETTFGKNTSPAPASAASGRPGRLSLFNPSPNKEKEEKPSSPAAAGDDPRLHFLRHGEGKSPPIRMVLTKEDQERQAWLKKHRPDLFLRAEGKTGGADSDGGDSGDSAPGSKDGGEDGTPGKGKNSDDAGQEAPSAEVRETREWFQSWAARGRKVGLKDAADNLDRYLSGKGGTKTYTPQQSRAFDPVRDAAKVNSDRFEEDTFLGDSKNPSIPKLRNIKDGETVNFEDNWDRDFTDFDSLKQAAPWRGQTLQDSRRMDATGQGHRDHRGRQAK